MGVRTLQVLVFTFGMLVCTLEVLIRAGK